MRVVGSSRILLVVIERDLPLCPQESYWQLAGWVGITQNEIRQCWACHSSQMPSIDYGIDVRQDWF